ncbi:MAG TPA: ABC transporter permease subunit, partial [Aggregatilineales bacterium]|nr:ABC transporter permease subunit [Aggregatilineales bacterium]
PSSLREAGYGLGTTKWQMIRTIIFPQALPSILTGTILSVSRAFGETAPLVVVGSITRITVDPEGPFSRFTAIPIQIYTWTAQPQDAFRSAAGAAIIVLLFILLLFNSVAIILRNRLSRRY